MKVRVFASAALVLALFAVSAGQAVAKSTKATTAHYYLALGDSLSVGYQPNAAGIGHETTQGYTNDLNAYYAKQVKGLKLVEVGCPGDTTTSLLTGTGNTAAYKQFHCDRKGGSQLKAAEAFLKAHHAKGEVPLVTIDIGANDVDGCISGPLTDLGTCLATGEAAIKANTPKILAGLHAAAGKGVKFVAMNLYDPVLSAYFDGPYATVPAALGEESTALLTEVNKAIATADTAGHFITADVADAFDSFVTTPEEYDGALVPENVVKICELTYMCAAAPQGPNIHARPLGYATIAGAFEKVIGKL